MNLAEYASNPVKRNALARAVGANPQYMYQMAVGWNGKRPSPGMARKIESATNGIVTRYELRPDIFGVAPETKVA